MGSIFDEAGKMRKKEKLHQEAEKDEKKRQDEVKKINDENLTVEKVLEANQQEAKKFNEVLAEYQEQLRMLDTFYDKLPFAREEVLYYKENPDALPKDVRKELEEFKEEIQEKIDYTLLREGSKDHQEAKVKEKAKQRKRKFLGDQRGWMRMD